MIDPMAPAPSVAVSIISHGHGSEVDRLLGELAALDDPHLQRVIVTLNQPEPGLVSRWRGRAWPFDLVPVERLVPLGFGVVFATIFAQALAALAEYATVKSAASMSTVVETTASLEAPTS